MISAPEMEGASTSADEANIHPYMADSAAKLLCDVQLGDFQPPLADPSTSMGFMPAVKQVLILKSLFPLLHGIEAYFQANGVITDNFRGYIADLCSILPLYVPRHFMGWSPWVSNLAFDLPPNF
ncbi:hypothetical protein K443DRAFT_3930 [Laccaria amethystina LaAM-08-1]|uniref:Uncharacterized protein n=1 Tax=Laccaria amethystina LaAM-08-1 TaxID=1095629 RepID=A0A0C9XJM8_9AGAR|nr:hypothetical protein K443DRAFT_3930 [Laccaria amethystina LaAM-08-1]